MDGWSCSYASHAAPTFLRSDSVAVELSQVHMQTPSPHTAECGDSEPPAHDEEGGESEPPAHDEED